MKIAVLTRKFIDLVEPFVDEKANPQALQKIKELVSENFSIPVEEISVSYSTEQKLKVQFFEESIGKEICFTI